MNPIPKSREVIGCAARQPLIVDDTPQNLTILGELLQPYYRVTRQLGRAGAAAPAGPGAAARSHPARRDDARHGWLRGARAPAGSSRTRPCPGDLRDGHGWRRERREGLELGRWITSPTDQPGHRAGPGAHPPGAQAYATTAWPSESEWLEREVARRMSEIPADPGPQRARLACLERGRDKRDWPAYRAQPRPMSSCWRSTCSGNEAFRPALDNGRLQDGRQGRPAPRRRARSGCRTASCSSPGALTPGRVRHHEEPTRSSAPTPSPRPWAVPRRCAEGVA